MKRAIYNWVSSIEKQILITLLFGFSSLSLLGQEAYFPNDEEIQIILEEHNLYREEVDVPPLVWSDTLAQVAADWAVQLVEMGCAFEHSGNEYGENLWKGTTGAFPLSYVILSWGEEKDLYNYAKNKCKGVCGHYTQIVWDSTEKVGCAASTCDGMTTWVCNYDPPGNYVGQKPY